MARGGGTVVTYGENPPWAATTTRVGGSGKPHRCCALSTWWHNEEHGGVLLLYNCDAGCPELVAQLQRRDRLPAQDPFCTSEGTGVKARVLLAPDPDLDVPCRGGVGLVVQAE